MKKALLFTFLSVSLIMVSPSVTHAAWWNPVSWFRNSASSVSEKNSIVNTQASSTDILPGDSSGNKTITLKIGESIKTMGVKATIDSLVEDSRCASGNQCVWAGTVKVKVRAEYFLMSKDIVFVLNQPIVLKGYSVALADVKPERVKDVKVQPSDYSFTFTVKKVADTVQNNNDKNSSAYIAQCLKNKGATFYGAFWCPHCQEQKALFKDAVKDLPYVECSTEDSKGQTPICQQEKITAYPTWKFKDGTIHVGNMSLVELSQQVGCNGTSNNVPETKKAEAKDLRNTSEKKPLVNTAAFGSLRVQGEMYKGQTGTSYAGFCSDGATQKILNSVVVNPTIPFVCNDSSSAWAASINIGGSNYICADSAGVMKQANVGLSFGKTYCQ